MSRNDLLIEDVSLQLDKSGRYIEGKVQVAISIKNNSKSQTHHVLKRPREVDYDKSTRTLSISLYEKPQPSHKDSAPLEPGQIAILPGATLHWQYLLPLWMKKITRPPGAPEIVQVLDLSGVQKVTCTVAHEISATFERTLLLTLNTPPH